MKKTAIVPPTLSAKDNVTIGRHRGWLLTPNIVYLHLGGADENFDGHINEQDAHDSAALTESLIPKGPCYSIVDMRNVTHSDAKSRRVRPSRRQQGIALLIKNALGRMIARAYLGVTHPPLPVRIFRDDKAAFEWIIELGD